MSEAVSAQKEVSQAPPTKGVNSVVVVVFIVLLILLVLGGVLFLGYSNFGSVLMRRNSTATTTANKNPFERFVGKNAVGTDGFVQYDGSSTLGVRISYPKGWTTKEQDDSKAVSFRPLGSTGFEGVVIVTTRVQPTDFVDLQTTMTSELVTLQNSFPSADIPQAPEATMLAGNSAYTVTYITKDMGDAKDTVKWTDTRTTKGGKLYSVTYFANTAFYTKYEPQVQEMLESFEIL